MNNKLQQIAIYITGAIFVIGGVIYAGSLEPSIDTDTTNFVTLDDIYHKTQDFNYSAAPHDISTSSEPLSSMHTLQDIWDSIVSNNITSDKIVSGNTIMGITGTGGGGGSAPTVWSADSYVTSYNCSWFTDMTDPMFSSESICSFNPGCTWDSGACTGGIQTSQTGGTMVLYGALQACAHSTEGGHAEGDWGLPTVGQLLNAGPYGSQSANNFRISPGTMYLSGVLIPNQPMMIYMVDMFSGMINPTSMMAATSFARCVLGGITSNMNTIPGTPAIGNATAGYDGQATVYFSPSLNGGGGMTTYTVTSDPESIIATGSSNPIVVTGLANGTAYTFTVTATNELGTSPVSAPSNPVTPIAPGAPGAPTNVNATAGDGQAEVTFDSPSNNGGSEITSYTVTSDPEGMTATGSNSPIIITGLTNNTAYTFTVTATNNAGTSPASTPSSPVTPLAPQCLPDSQVCSVACNAPFVNPASNSWQSNYMGMSNSCDASSDSAHAYYYIRNNNECNGIMFGGKILGAGNGVCAEFYDYNSWDRFVCPSAERLGRAVVNEDCITSAGGIFPGNIGGMNRFNANSVFFTGPIQ